MSGKPEAPAETGRDDTRSSPRNPWPRVAAALAAARGGRLAAAFDALEQLRYHPRVPTAVFELVRDRIDRIADGTPATIERPADYLMRAGPGSPLRPPFRHLRAGLRPPDPYPPSLALPPYPGLLNDTGFLRDAALALAPGFEGRALRVHILVDAGRTMNLRRLFEALRARPAPEGPLPVTLFGPGSDPDPAAPAGVVIDRVSARLLDPAAQPRILAAAETADLVVFLSGEVEIDPAFIGRAEFWARASEHLVLPLVERAVTAPPDNLFHDAALRRDWTGAAPHRHIQGLNLVVSGPLLRRAGMPDPRFSGPTAGRELGYRLGLLGAWFAPLPIPRLRPDKISGPSAADDEALYVALCPEAGLPRGPGQVERPRVSIYIPAYNAARYLRRAIDSVLEQDMDDLEVCLCDDGSTDETPELLARHYADVPRVRWVRHRNGGIGFGSNRAIELARAPYIGQLDSDDTLKPGAVRRLADYLDGHPDVVCAYGSCERIDADGRYIKDEYRWPVFSREKMMITSITHHFRMFRRAAWERTATFREDIVNGIDYDIFLKLSELGPFHHIDEILYQRRWHGENTSMVNETHQTTNTHRSQTRALERMGLSAFWEVHIPDPATPRRVTYRPRPDVHRVLVWPAPAPEDPYLHLLYGMTGGRTEICVGDLDAAGQLIGEGQPVTFHLHGPGPAEAPDAFIARLRGLVAQGLSFVWSPDTFGPGQADPAPHLAELATLAGIIHAHTPGRPEMLAHLPDWPNDRLCVTPHGPVPMRGPDLLTRESARDHLAIGPETDLVLCHGLTKQAARALADEVGARYRELRLMVIGAGAGQGAGVDGPVWMAGRALEEAEWPLLARAADVVLWGPSDPPRLTDVIRVLQAGLPVIAPQTASLRDIVPDEQANLLYDPKAHPSAPGDALSRCLADKAAGRLPEMRRAAIARAQARQWPDLRDMLRGRMV